MAFRRQLKITVLMFCFLLVSVKGYALSTRYPGCETELTETRTKPDFIIEVYKPVNPSNCPKGYFKLAGRRTDAFARRQHELKLAQIEVEKLWLLQKAGRNNTEVNLQSYSGGSDITNEITNSPSSTATANPTSTSSVGNITNTNDNSCINSQGNNCS